MTEIEKEQINSIDFTKLLHHDVGNGIYLTEEQKNILEEYQIPYLNCCNTTELIYYIEDILGSIESEELELLLDELSEFKYYHDTKK